MTEYHPWLHRYATFVAFCTFLLIIAGALVTGNDAGLSVPDWPTSFGTFRMPRMVGGVKFEHGHRMIAGTVGILTIILAMWIWRQESRRWVRWVAFAAVMAVLAQALLGGITVLFFLPVAISTAHATLGQIFFCLAASLAFFTSAEWRWDETKVEDTVHSLASSISPRYHRRHPGAIDSGRGVPSFQRWNHRPPRGGRLRGDAAGGLGGFHRPHALLRNSRGCCTPRCSWGDSWWRNSFSAWVRTL